MRPPGLPTVHGLITVLHPTTGRPLAIIDGTAVTTLRTAAASALAVDVLARRDASRLVVIGTGVQAHAHVRAIAAVRDLTRITVAGRRVDATRELADRLSDELGHQVIASISPAVCVPEADLVALCTASFTPVVEHGWIRPGSTVISVGSFTPDRCEVQRATVTAADLVVVDDLETSLEHAGPIIRAVQTGSLQSSDIVSLAEILAGKHPGRTEADDVVYYNSVGLGVQDAAAAETIVQVALAVGLGRTVPLGD